jgi:hypothetical protein
VAVKLPASVCLSWVCSACRGWLSEASNLSKGQRAERRLGKRLVDPRSGHRRLGESWGDEQLRERRARTAREFVEAVARKSLDRI